MTTQPQETSPILALYLQIAQYPVLARQIRQCMREELFRRGVITPQHMEQEATEKAVMSQHREGLLDPFGEESAQAWEQRLQQIRDHLTDFYFAYNLPLDLFQKIIEDLVAERAARRGTGETPPETRLTFNPELAPIDLLLRQARQYEALPAEERAQIQHHLEQIVVVLTRTMISDQLSFVRVAKAWFTAADFEFIQSRRIGTGKIGGKAAGMLLAWKVLSNASPDMADQVTLPHSYFMGADVFYDFKAFNGLSHNQKYKPLDQIRAEYPEVQETYARGRFPEDVAARLRAILSETGRTPLIVRSSSLLEDSFGTSFAGKYASYFCPNQGTPQENLRDLTLAIRRIYASVYSPDALIYRRRMGLLDYDERMAILLQEVQGETHGHYFFPTVSGVAFSQSPLIWTPRLQREAGFARLVLGLGTRAVERVGEDYPRLVFLSHPLLRPEKTPAAITHYSQHWADVIDLQTNTVATVPTRYVVDWSYPAVRWVASLQDSDADTLLPLSRLYPQVSPSQLVLTFENLLRRTDFVPLLRQALATLESHYGQSVDVEFAASLASQAEGDRPRVVLHLLQCRPQSTHGPESTAPRALPVDVLADDRLFYSTRMVPQGQVDDVEYLLYVDSAGYQGLDLSLQRQAVATWVGRLNKALEGRNFILVGPGRWGSSNLQLGVPVSYADIYNTRALVELTFGPEGVAPEPSYGTHFFQDLVESGIYCLAVYADNGEDFLNLAFLEQAHNRLSEVLPQAADVPACIKLIHIPSERPGRLLRLAMDGERALAYFTRPA